jgi:hypothetical protein
MIDFSVRFCFGIFGNVSDLNPYLLYQSAFFTDLEVIIRLLDGLDRPSAELTAHKSTLDAMKQALG